ncbi:carboxylesterase family protein [Aurantiacibacter suaedae]|uniref:carboxylesterase family protein n=1 Tax=Aurantiacibacter suaedae TaxID=2545755 RepID=UPI001386642C|nr:carboxylesterase family protein [Aurantiacibacter suaedae]
MKVGLLAFACLSLVSCANEAVEDDMAENVTQWPGLPAEKASQIAAIGPVIDPPASIAVVEGMVDAPPYDDVTVVSDLAYGDDPAQRLDVYTENSADKDAARPVLLFVHGGGFVGGSKAGDGFYPQNVTAFAARNGMVGVNMEYRFAPAAQWPAGRDDLAAAIEWVRDNIADYGGDPDQVALFGHSAGASHVADYVQHTDLHGPEFASVSGALLLSPYYTATEGEDHVYYGSDTAAHTADAAITRLGAVQIPLMLVYAEHDPEQFTSFAEAVEAQLCGEGASGNCPTMLLLKGHNHITEGATIGSTDQSLSGPFLEWVRGL